jgi:hypothetical protein
MPTPDEARRAMRAISDQAVRIAIDLVALPTDDFLVAAPEVIAYYSDGTAALAADHYDDLRDQARPRRRFSAEPVVNLRDEKIRRGLIWAQEPLYIPEPSLELASERLAEVVSLETARPFRDTILTNQQRDPSAVGWRRHTSGDSCKLCRMLSDRGAVYRQETARFAAHGHCSCSASPVFDGEDGEEANVYQYLASSGNRRSPRQQKALRDYLNTNYADAPG